MKLFLSRLLLAAGVALFASTASAQSVPASFDILAAVQKTCTFTAASATIDLGTYDPTGAAIATALPNFFTISCTKGTTYTVHFDKAAGAMANTGPLVSADTLAYTLTEIGNTTAVPTAVPGAGSPYRGVSIAKAAVVNMGFTVRVAANQEVDYGSYRDTVTATFNY